MSSNVDLNMAYHLQEPAAEQRKRKHKGHEEPTKRQRTEKAKLQRPVRRSNRVGTLYEQPLQHPPVTKKDTPITPPNEQPKRPREAEQSYTCDQAEPPSKRSPPSADAATTRPANRETQPDTTKIVFDLDSVDSGAVHWIKEDTWPKEYFVSGTMSHLLARRKSTPSLRRKRSESGSLRASSTTPSDQKPREEKSAPYMNPRYRTLLETKNSYMDKSPLNITDESKHTCRILLEREQVVPSNTLFQDEVFDTACRKLQDKNEARIVQDIARLIVPSAETLATFGAQGLRVLVESVNEGWNNSSPLTGTRPQPDYSVGFRREAFSEEQRKNLAPFIGDFIAGDQSYFMATYYMYFPFLTCEVKCGAAALDVADRQNAHSMTLAVRAVVELFRLAKRENEVNRQILAFSVSHDYRSVRIYGHYAVVEGSSTTFYRHPIHEFSFTALDGKEKWTTYRFIKNVYDAWMPTHFERLCSAIDRLPSGINFEVPPLQQDFGLSQDLESHQLSGSCTGSVLQAGDDDSQAASPVSTPDTSFTQQGVSKRQRGRRAK